MVICPARIQHGSNEEDPEVSPTSHSAAPLSRNDSNWPRAGYTPWP